jgi:hypothetical protein
VQHAGRQRDSPGRHRANVNFDRPHLATDRREIVGIGDLLMTEEFGPRAIWRVSEIVSRSFAVAGSAVHPPRGRTARAGGRRGRLALEPFSP